ncbi:PREDICTED: protein YLS9-like [Tarenaya hassleriana]|uniref:protein YLS9-like n=1 Tax=Tarenaya hassleriana TaxID=28532 RepID=UPI00053C6BF6|nr:PREDICTED: protein YLS9-like [Tarenaya hassleriana]
MADANQPHLNGAYYGPSIPPPQKSYHHGRSRGSIGGGGCGSCLLKLLIALLIILGLTVLIFWLVVRPQKVKFHVTSASLTRFEHATSDNILRYNLALNVTVRNPNKRLGVYYDRIEARAYYEDKRFSTVTLIPFYQGHKNTTILRPLFGGQQLVMFNSKELREFNAENISGIYSIEVDFRLRIRFKLGKAKTRRFKPKVKCDLKVPLSSSNGTMNSSPGVFPATKCDFDF